MMISAYCKTNYPCGLPVDESIFGRSARLVVEMLFLGQILLETVRKTESTCSLGTDAFVPDYLNIFVNSNVLILRITNCLFVRVSINNAKDGKHEMVSRFSQF